MFRPFFITILFFISSFPELQAQDISNKENVATAWMNLISDLLRKDSIPPARCLRVYAYTGLALYESQVPGLKGYQSVFSYLSGTRIATIAQREYSSSVAANAAIASIIRNLGVLRSIAAIDSLESYYLGIHQKQATKKQVGGSVEFGRKVAETIFQWSKSDGTFNAVGSYQLTHEPGVWKPGPKVSNPPGINQGSLRTFVKDVVVLTFPDPPPVYSTDTASAFYRNATITFNARNSLTFHDSLIIVAWQPRYAVNYQPMVHLTKLLTNVLEKEKYSVAAASVVYAKNGMAMFDAVVTAFNALYHYRIIRPVTFIQNVMGKTDWNTLYFYDFYPSYPSNFASLVGASSGILAGIVGVGQPLTDSTQASNYGSQRFSSLNGFADKITTVRIIAGIEFPFTIDAGITQGRKVAELVNTLPFKKN